MTMLLQTKYENECVSSKLLTNKRQSWHIIPGQYTDTMPYENASKAVGINIYFPIYKNDKNVSFTVSCIYCRLF